MISPNDWLERVHQRVDRVGLAVANAPAATVATVLVAVSLLKSGIAVWNWFELSPSLLTQWQMPASAFQANVLLNALATGWQGLGLDPTSFIWQITQVCVTLVAFGVLAGLVIRRSSPHVSWLALAVILTSGISAVLWREIGRYDALYVIGVALAVLAASPWLRWLGVVVAATSSPEQALTAGLLLLLLSLLPVFTCWRATALRLIAGGLVVITAVQLWFAALGDPGKTRIGVLVDHLMGQPIAAASAYDTKQGFVQFTIEKAMVSLSAGPGLVWSYLGASVFLLVLIILVQRSWVQSAALLLIVVALPIVIAFTFGEDRTRDITLICAPVIIALTLTGSEHLAALMRSFPGDVRVWLSWVAILVTLIPATYFYLDAEEPWRWTKELLIALNNGVPMTNDGSMR